MLMKQGDGQETTGFFHGVKVVATIPLINIGSPIKEGSALLNHQSLRSTRSTHSPLWVVESFFTN